MMLYPFRKRSVPIAIFCYHKVGTVLFSKVFNDICNLKKWRFRTLLGQQGGLAPRADVTLFEHSLIDPSQIKPSFKGIHLVRDPRDIIVSGFLYHQRTAEKWCTNTDFSINGSIKFPQVPYSQQHQSEQWKAEYLKSLNGMSYQEKLKSLPPHEGLLFEMDHYGAWTIGSMDKWDYQNEDILELKFEDVMTDFDRSFRSVFEHLEIPAKDFDTFMEIAARHDLSRKSSEEIAKMKHVSSKETRKWHKYFEREHKDYFIQKFGDILVKLGYEKDHNW